MNNDQVDAYLSALDHEFKDDENVVIHKNVICNRVVYMCIVHFIDSSKVLLVDWKSNAYIGEKDTHIDKFNETKASCIQDVIQLIRSELNECLGFTTICNDMVEEHYKFIKKSMLLRYYKKDINTFEFNRSIGDKISVDYVEELERKHSLLLRQLSILSKKINNEPIPINLDNVLYDRTADIKEDLDSKDLKEGTNTTDVDGAPTTDADGAEIIGAADINESKGVERKNPIFNTRECVDLLNSMGLEYTQGQHIQLAANFQSPERERYERKLKKLDILKKIKNRWCICDVRKKPVTTPLI